MNDKILYTIGLITLIGNLLFSIIDFNWFAFLGWLSALCFFPYEKLKTEEIK